MSTKRRSRLAGAMQAKASIAPAEAPVSTGPPTEEVSSADTDARAERVVKAEPAGRSETRHLSAVESGERPAEVAAESSAEPSAEAAGESTAQAEPDLVDTAREVVEPDVPAAPVVRPEPPTEEVVTEQEKPTPPVKKAASKAKGSAGSSSSSSSSQPDAAARRLLADLTHLRLVIDTGNDQRRYVENLPRRSDKGTYLRLPVHLQDLLAEYCDRNTAPMQDFIAAVLDAYFRDIGALPRLGEGHRPNEEFFERLRREAKTYDY